MTKSNHNIGNQRFDSDGVARANETESVTGTAIEIRGEVADNSCQIAELSKSSGSRIAPPSLYGFKGLESSNRWGVWKQGQAVPDINHK
jgi:hypothetical protein